MPSDIFTDFVITWYKKKNTTIRNFVLFTIYIHPAPWCFINIFSKTLQAFLGVAANDL